MGDRRQIIWGFNTLDITQTKICLGGLDIGIICGEQGRIIFSGFWSINRPSRARPLSHVHCLVRCAVPSQCNAQSLWCSQFLNASTESRTPYISFCPKPIRHSSAMSAVNCIEPELSTYFQNASTEGRTTPSKCSFPLHGRATWGEL